MGKNYTVAIGRVGDLKLFRIVGYLKVSKGNT